MVLSKKKIRWWYCISFCFSLPINVFELSCFIWSYYVRRESVFLTFHFRHSRYRRVLRSNFDTNKIVQRCFFFVYHYICIYLMLILSRNFIWYIYIYTVWTINENALFVDVIAEFKIFYMFNWFFVVFFVRDFFINLKCAMNVMYVYTVVTAGSKVLSNQSIMSVLGCAPNVVIILEL